MAPSSTDLVAGYALPSNAPEVTATQLLELVSNATPYTDKGMVIVTTDAVLGSGVNQYLSPEVPDAATTTKWQRYIWIRISPQISYNSVVLSGALTSAYIWNPGASTDATYGKWIAIGVGTIGTGAISGAQIQYGTIVDSHIVSVSYSKLTGIPVLNIPANSVTTGMIVNGAITPEKLAPAGGTAQIPRIASGGIFEWYTQKLITALENPTLGTSDAGKPVIVNPSGTGFILGSAGTTQLITYQGETRVTAVQDISLASANLIKDATPVLTTSDTPNIFAITGLTLTTADLVSSSNLFVEVFVTLSHSNTASARNLVVALLDSTSPTPTVAVAAVAQPVSPGGLATINLTHKIANTSTSHRVFSVAVGMWTNSSISVHLYTNSDTSSARFNGIIGSSIKVTEHS